MENIEYLGESVIPGIAGHFFVLLSFVSALAATFAYFKASSGDRDAWLGVARTSFRIHSAAILGIILALFYILVSHLYEYDYAWKHSSNIMPMRYILSCFWEGQEGSILLWTFWHAFLANILIFKAGKWEAPVLAVIASVQVFLSSMLLGIFFGDFQLGINPFLLVRETAENFGMPWTANPNYLSEFPMFQDGRGLNPLLQNYWMTIHPPTLFLGFASVLVPFAYAIAGLWKKDHSGWMNAALPWAFFSVMILGTGILMGGAWAYEALSFGGFWAWDPVENSSLVPWLTLVAGAHLMLINRRKPTSLFFAYLLILISFVLVLYSTFLTRSGVLGDSSVHSFVDSGILPQLLVFLAFYGGLAAGMLNSGKSRNWYWIVSIVLALATAALTNWQDASWFKVPIILFIFVTIGWTIQGYRKNFAGASEEEHIWSREFWVYVGSLVLFLSSLQIITWTSLPVNNLLLEPFSGVFSWLHETTGIDFFRKLSEHNFAPPTNREEEYNRWQVPFAVIISLLIATGLYFRYKETGIREVLKKVSVSLALALGITLLANALGLFTDGGFALNALLFATLFAALANLNYFVSILRGKWALAGSSIAHTGFALLLLGALVSTSQSEIISRNSSIYDVKSLSKDLNNDEDIVMFEGDTLQLGQYHAVYRGNRSEGINQLYKVEYFEQVPMQYIVGDLVFQKEMIFECKTDHQASPTFVEDLETHWEFVPFPSERHAEAMQPWKNSRPGKLLFTLEPMVQLNERMGNAPEPDTKHYLDRDIYTHIKWGRTEEPETDEEGYLPSFTRDLQVGDTIVGYRSRIILDSLKAVSAAEKARFRLLESDIAAKAVLSIQSQKGDTVAEPLFILRDSTTVVPDVAELKEHGLKFTLDKIDPSTGKVSITTAEHVSNQRDFIVMQAIVFPGINILWLGCIVMIVGSIIAVWQRIILNRKSGAKSGTEA